MQRFADESGLERSVGHFPPGTSKWNKIEHRLFSFISPNGRGRPLVSYATLVDLIGATTTSKGLTAKCALDSGNYPTEIKVEDRDMAELKPVTCDVSWGLDLHPEASPKLGDMSK